MGFESYGPDADLRAGPADGGGAVLRLPGRRTARTASAPTCPAVTPAGWRRSDAGIRWDTRLMRIRIASVAAVVAADCSPPASSAPPGGPRPRRWRRSPPRQMNLKPTAKCPQPEIDQMQKVISLRAGPVVVGAPRQHRLPDRPRHRHLPGRPQDQQGQQPRAGGPGTGRRGPARRSRRRRTTPSRRGCRCCCGSSSAAPASLFVFVRGAYGEPPAQGEQRQRT